MTYSVPSRAYKAPPLPASALGEEADRLRWGNLLHLAAHASGLNTLRVGRRIEGAKEKGATWWFEFQGGPANHHLRSILPTQIIFDIGDDIVPGKVPTPWPETVAFSHAIADTCASLGLPIHMGLTSGKGVHIELYLDSEFRWASRIDMAGACKNCLHGVHPSFCREELLFGTCPCKVFEPADVGRDVHWEQEDPRVHIARRIITEAQRILFGDNEDCQRIRYDGALIAPSIGGQLVREWGERKSIMAPHRKILWHEGLGPAPRLPDSREEAYRQAEAKGQVRPTSIDPAPKATAFDTRWVRELTGSPCPTSPSCFQTDGWPSCADCPVGGC